MKFPCERYPLCTGRQETLSSRTENWDWGKFVQTLLNQPYLVSHNFIQLTPLAQTPLPCYIFTIYYILSNTACKFSTPTVSLGLHFLIYEDSFHVKLVLNKYVYISSVDLSRVSLIPISSWKTLRVGAKVCLPFSSLWNIFLSPSINVRIYDYF